MNCSRQFPVVSGQNLLPLAAGRWPLASGHRRLVTGIGVMLTLLSQRQVEFYRENGYLVVEALLDGEELERWRAALAVGMARHFSINARHNQGPQRPL